jgi:hypothetical protein
MVRLRALGVAGMVLVAGCAGPSRGLGVGAGPGVGAGRADGSATWNRTGVPAAPHAVAGRFEPLPAAAPAMAQTDNAGEAGPIAAERLSDLRGSDDDRQPAEEELATTAWTDDFAPGEIERRSGDDALPALPLALNVELPPSDADVQPTAAIATTPAESAAPGNRLASFEALPPRALPFDGLPAALVSESGFPLAQPPRSPFGGAGVSPRGFGAAPSVPAGDWGRPIELDPLPGPIEARPGVAGPASAGPASEVPGGQDGLNQPAPSPRRRVFSRQGTRTDAQIDPLLRPAQVRANEAAVAPRAGSRDGAPYVRRSDFTRDSSATKPHRCPTCTPEPRPIPPAAPAPAAPASVFDAVKSSHNSVSWRPHLLRRLREHMQAPPFDLGHREPDDVTQGRN